jgi:hypothetical protein
MFPRPLRAYFPAVRCGLEGVLTTPVCHRSPDLTLDTDADWAAYPSSLTASPAAAMWRLASPMV